MSPITTLSDIRYIIEQNVKDALENGDIINWSNDAQAELITFVEIPDTATIAVTTKDLSYPEPADIKRISRMWLQSERDHGVDRDIERTYRRYSGQIIFESLFPMADTLHVDFYKHLKYFTAMDDAIDVADRFTPLYTSYGQAQYYDLPHITEKLGEAQAHKKYEQHYARYIIIKESIASYYASQSQPARIKEVW